MKIVLYWSLAFIFIFTISFADAKKRSGKRTQKEQAGDPEFTGFWYEDDFGNKLEDISDYELGDFVQLVITANKASNGKLADIDMEEEACIFELISDSYPSNFGIINDIVLKGDSLDEGEVERELDDQTRLRFKLIEETDHCLTGYKKALKKHKRSLLCEKRSWPLRRRINFQVRDCY